MEIVTWLHRGANSDVPESAIPQLANRRLYTNHVWFNGFDVITFDHLILSGTAVVSLCRNMLNLN